MAGFVSYGSANGVRAVEQLRLTMAELQIADVRTQVSLSTRTDFEKDVFKPADYHESSINTMLDQVIAWGKALKELRILAKDHSGDGELTLLDGKIKKKS